LSKYGLLILDDFGMERETEYGQEIVFQVIDNRYQCRKPMIITTNLSLQTLKNPNDLEHERIYGRILEACIPIHFDGENLREKERQKKVREFRKLIIDRGKAGGGGDERD
jgi:DNA replication protein DnaC